MKHGMPLGAVLRAAREQKGLSIAEVADGTRIKTQVIEDLESNNFTRIPAPVYGKGFIKLYAEFLGLDPAPLVQEYAASHAVAVRPSLQAENESADRPRPEPPAGGRPTVQGTIYSRAWNWQRIKRDLAEALLRPLEQLLLIWDRIRMTRWGRAHHRVRAYHGAMAASFWQYAAIAVGVVIVLIFVISGISRFVRNPDRRAALGRVGVTSSLRLAEDPPAPYLTGTAP